MSKLETNSPCTTSLKGFSILVCGRKGIGKSSLVNCVLGEDVCVVEDTEEDAIVPTAKVTGYSVTLNEVQMTIFDSPGLQDGTADEASYLSDMKATCSDVDLVFYCLDMTQARWTPPETNSIRLLTETFGPSFWAKTIVVLTKANLLQSAKPVSDEEKSEQFTRWTVRHEKKFRAELGKVVSSMGLIPEDHIICMSTVPAVPAGSEAVQVLPNGKHFIGNLWVTCAERITSTVLEIFMQATNAHERLIFQNDIEGQGISFRQVLSNPSDLHRSLKSIWMYIKPVNKSVSTDQSLAAQIERTSSSPHSIDLQSAVGKESVRLPPKYPIIADTEDTERFKKSTKNVEGGLAVVMGGVIGGLVGSVVPAVGTMIGSVVGAGVGAYLANASS